MLRPIRLHFGPRRAPPRVPRLRLPRLRILGEGAGLECATAERRVDMKIGVSGASGHLGRAVVSELLQRAGGHEVVAITRTPETVSAPAHGQFGDYDRPESLATAYAGLDRLLIIPTPDPRP